VLNDETSVHAQFGFESRKGWDAVAASRFDTAEESRWTFVYKHDLTTRKLDNEAQTV